MSKMVIPTPNELYEGLRGSLIVLRAQWKYSRTSKTRIFTTIAVVSVAIAIAVMTQAGYLVKFAAVEQEGIIQTTAREYLSSFSQGELGGIGATILGLAILSAIASPFTGATATSFMPPRELASMSITKWHRFTDSLLSQFMSSISILQLLTLLTLTSMLSLDVTSAGEGILLTLFVWLNLVSLSIFSVWIAEYVHRRYGLFIRTLIFVGFLALIGVAILIDPNNGTTVFGIGEIYSNGITNIHNLPLSLQICVYAALLISASLIAYASAIVSSGAIMLPEKNVSKERTNVVYRGLGALNGHNIVNMMIRAPLRLPEIRKPIISAVIIGMAVTFMAPPSFAVQATITVVIPLVIALAWGANALSLIGGGMTWLISQPNGARYLPWVLFSIQVVGGIGLFTVIALPSLITGHLLWGTFLTGLIAVTGSTFVIARSATSKAFRKPSPTHYGSRGESTLAPVTTLQYTIRLALWGGMYGIIILSMENDQIRWSMLGAAVTYQLVRMVREQEYWNSPQTQRNIAVAVSND